MNTKEQHIHYWLDLAEYDMETARAMLDTRRYLYVGFMCHQVIEKALKGYYVSKFDEIPPYIHNLLRLAKLSDMYSDMSEDQKDMLDMLQPLNIEARYPGHKQKVLNSLTVDKCKLLITATEELYIWIKQKL